MYNCFGLNLENVIVKIWQWNAPEYVQAATKWSHNSCNTSKCTTFSDHSFIDVCSYLFKVSNKSEIFLLRESTRVWYMYKLFLSQSHSLKNACIAMIGFNMYVIIAFTMHWNYFNRSKIRHDITQL